jgi:DNA repair exonuclease SbcCD nuclease subunit
MAKIAHLADLHLGYSTLNRITPGKQNQREEDFERAALACADCVVRLAPDVVVVAGDTLHSTHISNTGLNGAVEFFERLKEAGIPAVVIGGNHDEAGDPGRFNALHLLRRHGISLYLEQGDLDIAGVRLHLMPFQVLARALKGRSPLRPFHFSTDLPNVLVAHGYASSPGIATPPEEVELPADWLTDPRFALACLGHIHKHCQLEGYEHVFYSGAVERRNFGERAETPGFWLHEVDADGSVASTSITVESLGLPLTPRPMIQHDIEAGGLPTDELDAKVQALLSDPSTEGAMVRLALTNVSAELDRSRAHTQWMRAFRAAGGMHLETVTQTRRVVELLDVEFAAPPVNISEAFEEFLSAQSYSDDDERRAMLGLGADVMAVAHEKLLTQEVE